MHCLCGINNRHSQTPANQRLYIFAIGKIGGLSPWRNVMSVTLCMLGQGVLRSPVNCTILARQNNQLNIGYKFKSTWEPNETQNISNMVPPCSLNCHIGWQAATDKFERRPWIIISYQLNVENSRTHFGTEHEYAIVNNQPSFCGLRKSCWIHKIHILTTYSYYCIALLNQGSY